MIYCKNGKKCYKNLINFHTQNIMIRFASIASEMALGFSHWGWQ